jgi:Family of unknown function (DUF5685)
MFGLMRAKKCGMSAAEKHFRRLHYCGTCKTIGSLYGQKSRLLLNHDTVFLAEILTALNNTSVDNWENSYQSYNCLNLPKTEMPLALQFAATANVILSEFKIADHITDEKKRRFKIAHQLFSKEFSEAEDYLMKWNFPLEKVREILRSQEKYEAESRDFKSLAEPTAQTTALFFSEGARLIGKSELETIAFEIGHAFGALIYLLDAFEDYEKDFKTNTFNAILTIYNLRKAKIPSNVKRKLISKFQELESKIVAGIYNLPIGESKKRLFSSRLQQNLQRKLQTNLPVIQSGKVCVVKPKQTIKERWHNSLENARKMAQGFSWQMPLVFLFVLILTFAVPGQTREARSVRECFDLSFNLIFLGAFLGSVLAFPSTIMQQISPEKLARKAKKRQEEGNGWCDSCDCCECDCDCCCCACDSCNFCEGDGCDCCNCNGCCDCSCD